MPQACLSTDIQLFNPQNQVWSYQDAVQIFARAYYQPQKKRVRAIHLLAVESSDLLLNAIALRKKDMFSGFVNKELGQGKVLLLLIIYT